MNKKMVIAATVAIAVFASGVYAFSMKESEVVVATVNGKPVYESEIRNKFDDFVKSDSVTQEMTFDTVNPEVKQSVIRSIILGELIDKEADASKIENDPAYKKALKYAQMQIRQRTFLEKLTDKAVSEENLKKKYKEFADEQATKDEFKARHILVKKESEAKEVLAKLSKGVKFEELAKTHSTDGSKNNGGDLGYFSLGQMVKPFEEAVKKLSIGKISDIVKTDFGFHIIKLEDKRKMHVPAFKEMRSNLKNSLSQEFMQNYIESLIQKNNVEIVEEKEK